MTARVNALGRDIDRTLTGNHWSSEDYTQEELLKLVPSENG
jgi:hypothetical protein